MGFDPARVIAIPNGVPAPHTYNSRSSQLIAHSSSLRLGCIARLSPEKGIDVLLHALENIPEVSLDIIGTGSDEGYLRTLIHQDTERMGGERIHIRKSMSSLDDFYASIDVLVLPSREHDPFGLVVAEAMMRGIPVIVTDACGVAGYLKDGVDALIVEANEPHALADAIRRILEPNFRKVLGEQGRATARKLFSIETMVKRYEKLIS
jgi:glycosyltransferase involved in cell wall biosynthesis